jgi:hypothetical protein
MSFCRPKSGENKAGQIEETATPLKTQTPLEPIEEAKEAAEKESQRIREQQKMIEELDRP